MEILVTRGIEAWLLPPGGILLLALVGLLLLRQGQRRGATALAALALLGLYALSIPVTARSLMGLLEIYPALATLPANDAQAIVVLGSGRYADAPEYAGDTLSKGGLERLRYAARLHRRTGLPLLLSGGDPFFSGVSEAALMKQALADDFRIEGAWLEQRSRSTAENARLTQALLNPLGINRVYLVTHAWHMPRAVRSFRRAGLQVIAAPTGFLSLPSEESPGVLDWLPRAAALETSSRVLHELLGMLWYSLRH